MLPSSITFNDVQFRLAPANSGSPDVVIAKGQSIKLPAGRFNRLYILAAAVDGDQQAKFEVGDKAAELNIEDRGGFIGQWDERQWSFIDSEHDRYGEMTGLKPGYIKRADIAWYCDHHHDAAGQNVPYSYSYLFAYKIDLVPTAHTIMLPENPSVRILAISVADQNPELNAAQPLYDVLPPRASKQ